MDHNQYLQSQAKRFSGENKAAQKRLKQAYKFFKPFVKPGEPLLDVGSRDGWFLEFLASKRYTDVQGIEITYDAVEHAQARGRNVVLGDAHNLVEPYQRYRDGSYRDGAFTTILMIHSLEHCHDPDKVVGGINRLLRPGGVVYIEVPLEDEPCEEVAHFCNFTCVEDVHKLLGDQYQLLKQQTVQVDSNVRHLLCAFRRIPKPHPVYVKGANKGEFTVAFVNYKTSMYMETQFKIYEKFAGEHFKIIVVDTSRNEEEYQRVQDIARGFNLNIRVVKCDKVAYSSEGHGLGLDQAYQMANSEYFIAQDPDFFWVKPQFLSYLREKLQNYTVVGPPYSIAGQADWTGHRYFPAAFGAAYQMDKLIDIEADFKWGGDSQRDVADQVRERLLNRPYYYFHQIGCEHNDTARQWSFSSNCTGYTDGEEGELLAYHLWRGSFEIDVGEGFQLLSEDPEALAQTMPSEEWVDSRKFMCDYFWKTINNA